MTIPTTSIIRPKGDEVQTAKTGASPPSCPWHIPSLPLYGGAVPAAPGKLRMAGTQERSAGKDVADASLGSDHCLHNKNGLNIANAVRLKRPSNMNRTKGYQAHSTHSCHKKRTQRVKKVQALTTLRKEGVEPVRTFTKGDLGR